MEYISTRNTKKTFSFKDVFLKGLAPDGGLFIPKMFPFYAAQELEKFRNLSYKELAAKIIFKLFFFKIFSYIFPITCIAISLKANVGP